MSVRERHCWVCGVSMGRIASGYYDREDTCGKAVCEREARFTRDVDRLERERLGEADDYERYR